MGFCRDDSAPGLLGQKAPVKAEKKQETGKEIQSRADNSGRGWAPPVGTP